MTMTQEGKTPFNQIPRYIASDFRAGKIGRNALFIYLWLSAIADPYAVATTSIEDLRADIFPELKKNTVNKALLELRKKRYVYYEVRQGQRGSFDVHLGDWRLPGGKGYKKLDKLFAGDEVVNSDYPQSQSSEASQKFGSQNQKLIEAKNELLNHFSANSTPQQFRSYQNENENEKKIENHESTLANKERTLVREFQPKTYEEQKCKEIAKAIGEEYINPLLHALRKHGLRGFPAIESAWGDYREDVQRGKHIDNPPAYFYGIVKKKLNDDR